MIEPAGTVARPGVAWGEAPVLPPGFKLTSRPSADMLDRIYALRVEAWRGSVALRPGVTRWTDRWDEMSFHRVVLDPSDQIAAAFRFSLHDDLSDAPDGEAWAALASGLPRPIGYPSRMFVLPHYRGAGLGGLLDLMIHQEPRRVGANSVVGVTGSVRANRWRVKAMQDAGWTSLGAVPGLDHAPFAAELQPEVLAMTFDRHADERDR